MIYPSQHKLCTLSRSQKSTDTSTPNIFILNIPHFLKTSNNFGETNNNLGKTSNNLGKTNDDLGKKDHNIFQKEDHIRKNHVVVIFPRSKQEFGR
jgi:hypothetical protein